MGAVQSVRELKREVAAYLRGQNGLERARIVEAFAAAQRDFPLREAVVAVGLDRVEAAPEGFGGYWGESGETRLHGAGASITLRFDLYLPTGADGGGVHELYEALCEHLLLRANPFGVYRVVCGGTDFDRAADTYHMTARATLRAALLAGERVERFEQLRVTRKETTG